MDRRRPKVVNQSAFEAIDSAAATKMTLEEDSTCENIFPITDAVTATSRFLSFHADTLTVKRRPGRHFDQHNNRDKARKALLRAASKKRRTVGWDTSQGRCRI